MNSEINYVSPFKKFCITIGNLPTSYLESMSYYESLTYLVNYLANNVIPALNNNGEVVEELQNQFTILKNYVDTYFDNLDVQEEINNKLDEMAESGQLTDIIAQYLGLAGMITFDTLADMKAAENLVNGSKCCTLGYYNVNDGGNALYKVRTITNDDVIDEMFIIELNDDYLVAELITNDKVNICQIGGQQNFGQKCNYALSLGKSIYIPKLNFNCEQTIEITNPETIFICDGKITFTDTNSTFIKIKSSRNVIEFNNEIEAGETNVFCEIGAGGYCSNTTLFIENVKTSKIGILCNPNETKGVQYLNCTFNLIRATEKGIYFEPGINGEPWINQNRFVGGVLISPYGIVTRKSSNQTDPFNGNQFINISYEGLTSDSHVECFIDLEYMYNSEFLHNRIVEFRGGTYDIKLNNCNNLKIENEGVLELDKINVTNSISSSHNIMYGRTVIAHTGDYISNVVEYIENDIFIPNNECWRYASNGLLSYSSSSTDFSLPEFYFNDITVVVGDSGGNNSTLVYTLPKMFNADIQSFYLYVQNKQATSDITLKTQSNETIVNFPAETGSLMTFKLFHIVRGTSRGTHLPKWKVIKCDYIDPAA